MIEEKVMGSEIKKLAVLVPEKYSFIKIGLNGI